MEAAIFTGLLLAILVAGFVEWMWNSDDDI